MPNYYVYIEVYDMENYKDRILHILSEKLKEKTVHVRVPSKVIFNYIFENINNVFYSYKSPYVYNFDSFIYEEMPPQFILDDIKKYKKPVRVLRK